MHPPAVIAEQKKNRDAYDAVKERMEEDSWGKIVLLSDPSLDS